MASSKTHRGQKQAGQGSLALPFPPAVDVAQFQSPPQVVQSSALSDAEREWYSAKFDAAIARKRGEEFQRFFNEMMAALCPGDFELTDICGALGDLKCDGYLRSKQIVFQVYAPREMKASKLSEKIREDFAGAKKHWAKDRLMRGWILVHNDRDGLPAPVVKELEQLRLANSALGMETWGPQRLYELALSMPRTHLIREFGRPPTAKDFEVVGFQQVAVVLNMLRTATDEPDPQEIRPVPVHKLEVNKLSRDVASWLQQGRRRDPIVEQYLQKHPNPSFGDEIAAAFRAKYEELRAEGHTPDHIFWGLQEFTGGSARGEPKHEAAVFAVLSYFFDRCDIFEETER